MSDILTSQEWEEWRRSAFSITTRITQRIKVIRRVSSVWQICSPRHCSASRWCESMTRHVWASTRPSSCYLSQASNKMLLDLRCCTKAFKFKTGKGQVLYRRTLMRAELVDFLWLFMQTTYLCKHLRKYRMSESLALFHRKFVNDR